MTFIKIASTVALASIFAFGAFAEEKKVAETSAVAAPIVGGSTIGIEITKIMATGYRASKLIGSNVYNQKAEKIGNVDDIIISSDNSVSFAVISVGGFLGMGSRHVAVPASLFKANEKGQVILPKASKDELMALPEFQYVK